MKTDKVRVVKNGKYLDKFTLSSNELRLLSSADGVEIMTQTVNKGVIFLVAPAGDENNINSVMEFFYILEGELEYLDGDSGKEKLVPGDCFYTQYLKEDCVFNPITDVKLLYISTQPLFHLIGDSLKDLHKLNEDLQKKDQYTKSHSERVRNISLKLAFEMGLNRDSVGNVALAALFHDVGKIEIPDDILKKEDKLNDEEYRIIRNHSTRSSSLVKNIEYKDISTIVEQHHERFDGSGYPHGIKGEDICIEARIIAVADTFDAMVSDRPYRAGLKEDVAIAEINQLSGIWYDPDVVDAFNRMISKKK
ncbi:HD domain-containing protein [Mycoplasmatota bacterium WC44]